MTHNQVKSDDVRIAMASADVVLDGNLSVPEESRGIVLFAHGSGSSRHSRRNRFVADVLNEAGLATLLFDLLTAGEEQIDLQTRALRFDIPLLTERLVGAVDWVRQQSSICGLPIGLFGASTGAAAALQAAAARPDEVAAVVSRGGRPDLADACLPQVKAPTLMIVGGADTTVIALNREASRHMRVRHCIEIVPGATHLFEEPGTLEVVAGLARDWFLQHLSPGATPPDDQTLGNAHGSRRS